MAELMTPLRSVPGMTCPPPWDWPAVRDAQLPRRWKVRTSEMEQFSRAHSIAATARSWTSVHQFWSEGAPAYMPQTFSSWSTSGRLSLGRDIIGLGG
jgi:hypothetical protein